MDTLYLIVPCYNEEEALPVSAPVFLGKLRELIEKKMIAPDSRVMFVDDGSSDGTWDIIKRLHAENGCVDGLRLEKNRGHQNAVAAGLATAIEYAGVTVTMDADLQDDIDVIDVMAEKYNAGCPIVCGVRRRRSSDALFKSVTARGYYILMNLFGAKLIYDHADFRLLSRKAAERLLCFGTEDLFLRGLITRLDLPIEKVYYDRAPRNAGESKYTLRKMLHLARRGLSCGGMTRAETPQIGKLWIAEVLHD